MLDALSDVNFEHRFDNWVRWCKARNQQRHVRCESIESRYVVKVSDDEETGWGDWEQRDTVTLHIRRPRIDPLDAAILNAAFVRLPIEARKCLKLFYFRTHLKETWIARKLGVHVLSLHGHVRACKLLLRGMI